MVFCSYLMFIKWYSMNSIKKIWGIRCNSNPNFTRILLVIPYKKHISPINISFYARITLNTAEYCENLGYSMIFFFIDLQFAINTSKPPAPVALQGRLCLSGKPHEFKRSLVWLNWPSHAKPG